MRTALKRNCVKRDAVEARYSFFVSRELTIERHCGQNDANNRAFCGEIKIVGVL